MSELLKEPLLHLLVLGAALFGETFAAAPLEATRLWQAAVTLNPI
ncbi:MAG: hypothetical protein ACREWE_08035 [Gammaproteobacteria bacterium]